MLFITYAVVFTVDIDAVYVVIVAIAVVVVPAADVVSDAAVAYPFAAVVAAIVFIFVTATDTAPKC